MMTEAKAEVVELIERAIREVSNDSEWIRNYTPTIAARVAESLLSAGIVGSGWRPIESAPKDGTPILAVSTNHAGTEVVCWFAGEADAEYPADQEGWVDTGPQRERFYANPLWFTHWQPLPAPPLPLDGAGS